MSLRKVLIVGGGFTGLTTAIALAQRGSAVTLIDKAPAWARVGHGLTIQGNALRVLKELGVIDEVLAVGAPEYSVTLYHADGSEIVTVQTPRTGGDDLPPTIGALRPDLHEILARRAESLGVRFVLGLELADFENGDDTVTATLSDGSVDVWDAVVIAEGIKSPTRARLGIVEDRAPTGLGIWRAVTSRLPGMDGGLYYPSVDDGGAYKVGYTPVSADQCYIYVLCRPERPDNGLADWQEIRRLMENFHGEFDYLRETVDESTFLNFQEIEWIFVEGPWHKGRVIALGEAVHAVPPLVAQGAAQCVEDSLVFADCVAGDGDWEEQLAHFYERRIPRIRSVVDASMLLAKWELTPGLPEANPGRVIHETLHSLVPAP